MKLHFRSLLFWAAVLLCTSLAQAQYQECTGTISSNFNGTAIAQGDYIWFTGALKASGLGSGPTTLYVTHASISFAANGTTYTVHVPNSVVTFSSSTTLATTEFAQLHPLALGKGWETELQLSGLAGNDLMTAAEFKVPAPGLPGGVKNVMFTATFSSYTPGITVNWQWAAAVYTSFDAAYNGLGVKPVDDNNASMYKNSDHAGTPENYKSFVIGGAMGGGGSNFTGSLSATGSCALTTDGSDSMTIGKQP